MGPVPWRHVAIRAASYVFALLLLLPGVGGGAARPTEDPHELYRHGKRLYDTGDLTSAVCSPRHSIERAPGGTIHSRSWQAQAFRRVLQASPAHLSSSYHLANVLFEMGAPPSLVLGQLSTVLPGAPSKDFTATFRRRVAEAWARREPDSIPHAANGTTGRHEKIRVVTVATKPRTELEILRQSARVALGVEVSSCPCFPPHYPGRVVWSNWLEGSQLLFGKVFNFSGMWVSVAA
jgi:hypothetical protein